MLAVRWNTRWFARGHRGIDHGTDRTLEGWHRQLSGIGLEMARGQPDVLSFFSVWALSEPTVHVRGESEPEASAAQKTG